VVAVVTGANRGLGLEFCRQLKDRKSEVVAVCRQSSTGLENLGVRIIAGVDVTRDDDRQSLYQELSQDRIELLVNNAGILSNEHLDDLNAQRILNQFTTNALAPLLLTQTLLPLFAVPSKIAMITSRMGSIKDNTSGSRYGYRMSKCALNMAGVSLAHDVKAKGIALALLHPGYVRTGMTGHNGHIDSPESVRGLLQRIDELTLATTGQFWHMSGSRLDW
jgi:NAD(P)-dependent dehydrogenase (short-subunit alcohol dehydrogenase family)